MTTVTDPGEANRVQGDLVRAVQQIVIHQLPLTTAGAAECERIMREFGEGYRALWAHPHYLETVVFMAQEIVRIARLPPGASLDDNPTVDPNAWRRFQGAK